MMRVISTVIFGMVCIGIVMPIENEMQKPQQFLGCPGVLNVSLNIVIVLFGAFGFFGYVQYGDAVKGSITLNLPGDSIVAQSAKFLMAIVILFSYTLMFYVPMEMINRTLASKPWAQKYYNVTQVSIRFLIVITTVSIAAAFPNLELVISLAGAIFFSTFGLLFPAIIDTVYRWDRGLGPLKYILWKNLFICIISIFALVSGSYVSIEAIIEDFSGSTHTNET